MRDFNPFTLEGKTVLVTGSSSGIGRGVAITCAKMGAAVVLNARNRQKLETVLGLLPEGEHRILDADLTRESDLRELVEQLPKLDGVVHCAGVGQRTLCKMLTGENVDSLMNINFRAPVLLQQALLQGKKINKCASVVFIASIATWSPSIGNAIYSASKGAIVSYANCLSLELAPQKIRVNCISPAMVWTELIMQDGFDKEQFEEDEKKYPLKRYGTPEDVANLVVYMLSDASSWMTGSNVKISGGGRLGG